MTIPPQLRRRGRWSTPTPITNRWRRARSNSARCPGTSGIGPLASRDLGMRKTMPDELLPGLYHWTAFHPGIGSRVSSYYVEPPGVVLDPKLPDDGSDPLPGPVTQILLTSGHHTRDAAELAERLSVGVSASQE